MTEAIVLGLVEDIEFVFQDKVRVFRARIDTGATKSSIDIRMASELRLGPVITSKLVKSAHGTKLRPVVEAEIILKGKHLKTEFTLADRTHMKYPVLVGVNILELGFLVNPSLKNG